MRARKAAESRRGITVIPRLMPDSSDVMGILHPDTSLGLAFGTSMVQNWYRCVKYPSIPTREGRYNLVKGHY